MAETSPLLQWVYWLRRLRNLYGCMAAWLHGAWAWLRHLHCCSGCIGCEGWEISMAAWAWAWAWGIAETSPLMQWLHRLRGLKNLHSESDYMAAWLQWLYDCNDYMAVMTIWLQWLYGCNKHGHGHGHGHGYEYGWDISIGAVAA